MPFYDLSFFEGINFEHPHTSVMIRWLAGVLWGSKTKTSQNLLSAGSMWGAMQQVPEVSQLHHKVADLSPIYFRKQKPPQIRYYYGYQKNGWIQGFGVDFSQGQKSTTFSIRVKLGIGGYTASWLLSGSVCDLRIEQAIVIQWVKLFIRLSGIDEVEVILYWLYCRDL